jgi:hypothetical protein
MCGRHLKEIYDIANGEGKENAKKIMELTIQKLKLVEEYVKLNKSSSSSEKSLEQNSPSHYE